MDEKLYAKREVIKVGGREVEIPVISTHPEHQAPYREARQEGVAHEEAERYADNKWQTRWYAEWVIIYDQDGKHMQVPRYSQDKDVQEYYQYLRAIGESHNSADMAISRRGPLIGLCD